MAVARRCPLPSDEFAPAWNSIMLPDGIRQRLLSPATVALTSKPVL